MMERAKTGHSRPKSLMVHSKPTTAKQALAHPELFNAMKLEYNSLLINETWTLNKLPPHRKPIGCKWVCKLKKNPNGSINKYKSRLVAKGFHQQEGFDFQETFSPLVKPTTIRIIETLVVTFKWETQQIDINNAFLNGDLQEEVYMHQPPGFVGNNATLFCKLKKAIYGLKQAHRAWYEKLHRALL